MIEVNWISPINSPSGYATVNRCLVCALVKSGVKVNLVNQKTFDVLTLEDYPKEQKKILDECFKNKINPKVPTVYYTTPHNWNSLKVKNSVYDIVGSMFEVDRIPQSWVEVSTKVNEFWIPSIFNLETYYKSGVDINKLHVMPLGANTEFYKPCEPNKCIRNKRKFAFISLFQWTYRKGYDTLINAFIEEFKADENVCLMIKTYYASYREEHNVVIRNEVKNLVANKTHAPILLYFGLATPEELRSFYNSGDCFVMPTRGEGWNMPLIEAMSCEIPSIVTDWSAHRMFATEETVYLLDYKMTTTEAAKLTRIFGGYKGTRCAEPSKEHLKQTMRYVYEHQDEAKERAKHGRKLLQQKFSWEQAAKNIKKRLEEIQCMI